MIKTRDKIFDGLNGGTAPFIFIALALLASILLASGGKLYLIAQWNIYSASVFLLVLTFIAAVIFSIESHPAVKIMAALSPAAVIVIALSNYLSNWQPDLIINFGKNPVLMYMGENFGMTLAVSSQVLLFFFVLSLLFVKFYPNRGQAVNSFKSGVVLYAFMLGVLFFYVFLVFRNAWVNDDAYITFRTMDNFVNGFGLRWNISERVQSFTNPLWLFFVSAFYFFTREAYNTAIILSVFLSAFAFYLIVFKGAGSKAAGLIAGFILIMSKAYIDYSTSGLENPLGHVILALFFIIYLKGEEDKNRLFRLSIIAAFGALNRLDLILVFVPALAQAFITQKDKKAAFFSLIKGFTPLLAWLVFASVYYGFPFPNTYYAKTNTGLAVSYYLKHGLMYLADSISRDYVTLPALLAGMVTGIVLKKQKMFMASLGILLYLLYVVKVGGCFMSGRFFTAPLIIAAVIISSLAIDAKKIYWAFILILISFLGISAEWSTLINNIYYGQEKKGITHLNVYINKNEIADERGFYAKSCALMNAKGLQMPNAGWALYGKRAREKDVKFTLRQNVGIYGYFAGPGIHIVDVLALSEPMLARIKTDKSYPLMRRIGHFERYIPDGYIDTVLTGENRIKNNNLNQYYEKLVLLTKGRIFSAKRLAEIFKMNAGVYNKLTDGYNFSSDEKPAEYQISEFNQNPESGVLWYAAGNRFITYKGCFIKLEKIRKFSKIEIWLSYYLYRVELYKGGKMLFSFNATPENNVEYENTASCIVKFESEIPASVRNEGVDMIKVIPLQTGSRLPSSIAGIKIIK